MMTELNRRKFVRSVAGGLVVASHLPNAIAAGRENENRFSFLLFGDTHYDKIEHHDLDWMRNGEFAKSVPQVENYCRHTTEMLPKLIKAAKSRVATIQPPTAFALHVGDLVEGICGSPTLAMQHCVDAWNFFKSANLGVPLLMTKGNHDITGPGAVEAYKEVLLKGTAQELGRDSLDRTSYSFMQGDNLFAVFDAYDSEAIDWLEDLTESNRFNRLFVLLHMPVVPYNARSNWRVYYHERHRERRDRLVDLLGRHHAIVLSGHLHKYCLLVRRCKTGKFVQIGISSVLRDTNQKRELALTKVDEYGPRLTDLEPTFSPETREIREHVLSDETPFIEHFEYANQSGFAMLSVDHDDVQLEIDDPADELRVRRTVSLSRLLS